MAGVGSLAAAHMAVVAAALVDIADSMAARIAQVVAADKAAAVVAVNCAAAQVAQVDDIVPQAVAAEAAPAGAGIAAAQVEVAAAAAQAALAGAAQTEHCYGYHGHSFFHRPLSRFNQYSIKQF